MNLFHIQLIMNRYFHSMCRSHISKVTQTHCKLQFCNVASLQRIPTFAGIQGYINRSTCSYPELTSCHVLTSAYVMIFWAVARNAVNKGVWRKKGCSWLPLNQILQEPEHGSLRIRAHLSWRTGKHLHVLHVLRTYPTCSYPGYQDTTTYAALYV